MRTLPSIAICLITFQCSLGFSETSLPPGVAYRATSVTLNALTPRYWQNVTVTPRPGTNETTRTAQKIPDYENLLSRWTHGEKCDSGLNGDAVKALLIAHEKFIKDEVHGFTPDIRNFRIKIYETSASVYIGFCPNSMPGKDPWTLGGATGAGHQIDYEIEKSSYKILRELYAE